MNYLFHIGQYVLFLKKIFKRPEKARVYYTRLFQEVNIIGVKSTTIVIIISAFIGAVIALQTAYNTENPLYPKYILGLLVRDTVILEFSSTIIAIILAGKVGSNIASEIGTMRITEQIDALEIMGVNSSGYLVLPKIIASLMTFPLLCAISMIVAIIGGLLATVSAGLISVENYIYGIQFSFYPLYVYYSLAKTLVFAFIIVTVSSYQGYYVKGGAIEVGRASTRAVVFSSILILLADIVMTQLILS